MKPWAAAVVLAAAVLAGRPSGARPAAVAAPVTLADLLRREGIEVRVTRAADLAKPVTSGDVLDTAKVRIVATYVAEGEILGDRVYVFRRAKPAGKWRAAEVRWPRDSRTACHGGSITRIVEAAGFLYLDGHLGPSTACTMVLTRKLALYDTWFGWPMATLRDGRVIFEASQSNTRFGYRSELSLYDPVHRRSLQFHPPRPPRPIPALRRAYLAKFRAVCARCCGETVPQDCGAVFLGRNHPCDRDRFASSIGEVAVNDDTGALAFTDRFEDVAGDRGVVYVYRRLRGGAFEVREIGADPGEPGHGVPLASWLRAGRLKALFAVE